MTDKQDQEGVQRIQMLEQSMQSLAMQKQQFQAQLFEIEGALREVETASETFKIVGGLMIHSEKEKLQKDLASKKEMLELRLESLEKQEEQCQQKMENLQKEIKKE